MLASAIVISPISAPNRASAARERTVDARLSLVHIGRDGRTLVLDYDYGGCTGPARLRSVLETRSTVEVKAEHRELVAGSGPDGDHLACQTAAIRGRLLVRLRRRVQGRRVLRSRPLEVGLNAYRSKPGRRLRDATQTLPRVVSLAPTDAYRLLGAQGYRTRTRYLDSHRLLSRVVAQRPSPGFRRRFPKPIVTLWVRR